MRLPALLQPRVLREALRSLFSRPFTTRFPDEPFVPDEAFRGRPRFVEQGCVGCGACAQVCPPKCIEVIDDLDPERPTRTLIQHLDACIWCGQCERHCPTGAGIELTTEWDCLGVRPEDFEERVQKELLLCEVCGGPVAPTDQLRWLYRRLGPLAFANPTLMLVALRDLGTVDPSVKSGSPEAQRADRLRLQCPKCRHRTSAVV